MAVYKPLRVAIVYDWIDKWGGVERVLLTLAAMYPRAQWYTSYFDAKTAAWAKKLPVTTSFIQTLPNFIKKSRVLSLPFYPYAFESFTFNEYDLVISVTSSFAKAVVTKPEILHVCYLLTPTRYFWVDPESYLQTLGFSNVLKNMRTIGKLKKWDKIAAQRPDEVITISKTVKERTKKFYGRDSSVIYPPFDVEYWERIKSKVKNQKAKVQLKSQNYYLVVSRLEPYKKVDFVIDAFNKSGKNLVVVGTGSQEKMLKQKAGNTVQFISNISDEELGFLYSNAQALIMPQEEDFGYVSLESQFFGTPVLAYKKGGATETTQEEVTGLFFERQTAQEIVSVVERYETIAYNLKQSTRFAGAKIAKYFDTDRFATKFSKIVADRMKVIKSK